MKLLLILIFPFTTVAQTYTGTIINAKTQQPIPYATIGLILNNTGSNADVNGYFTVIASSNDTLVVSSVGYKPVKLPLNIASRVLKIELEEHGRVLSNVVVGNKQNIKSLNLFSNCGMHSYTSNRSVTQLAQHFRIEKANATLRAVTICKGAGNSIFRIRIYGRNPLTGAPAADLSNSIIEVKSGKRYVTVDLEDYNIVIPGNDFFIAVEWLFIAANQYKVRHKGDGQKFTTYHFEPNISMNDRRPNDSSTLESWGLRFDGSWFIQRGLFERKRFYISPTVSD